MFVNLIRFPALTEGQEAAFVARLQPSTQVYREFPGFVPRRLLRWTDGSYAAVVENEGEDVHGDAHPTRSRRPGRSPEST